MTCANSTCPFHDRLVDNGLFADADDPCLFADTVKKRRFASGEVLFTQGQASTCLYSLHRGLVKIACHTSDGREQIVGFASPGKLLVGLQSISDDDYAYSAVAETDVVACKIRHRGVLEAARSSGAVALRLIAAINAQLAYSRELMCVLGRKCASAKIASFIALIVPASEHCNRRFTLPFSRGEIASLLGLSEETVCRQMAMFKRDGILYAPRGNIEILDWNRLRAVADEKCAYVVSGEKNGGPPGARTPDQRIKSPMLYQLS